MKINYNNNKENICLINILCSSILILILKSNGEFGRYIFK